MKKSALLLGLIYFLFNAATTLAQSVPSPSAGDPYYQISKISTHVIAVEENIVSSDEILKLNLNKDDVLDPLPSLLPQVIGGPLDIADIVFKIWDIIKSGAPIVNAEYKNVTALPNIASKKWEALTGWKPERGVVFSTSVENAFGMKTVDLEYKVQLLYGGGYKGKGQYIASARVVPTKVDVMWGYNLDVSVQVPTILNIASTKDPLASISMDVTYKISTMLRTYSESNNYVLQGDGLMKSGDKIFYEANSR